MTALVYHTQHPTRFLGQEVYSLRDLVGTPRMDVGSRGNHDRQGRRKGDCKGQCKSHAGSGSGSGGIRGMYRSEEGERGEDERMERAGKREWVV